MSERAAEFFRQWVAANVRPSSGVAINHAAKINALIRKFESDASTADIPLAQVEDAEGNITDALVFAYELTNGFREAGSNA